MSAVNTVKLVFDADVADVNVIPAVIPNDIMANGMVRLHVFATGSIVFLGNADQPLKVTLDQQVIGNTATVTAHVTRTVMWPFTDTLKVTCDLYANRRTTLDRDVAFHRYTQSHMRQNNFRPGRSNLSRLCNDEPQCRSGIPRAVSEK